MMKALVFVMLALALLASACTDSSSSPAVSVEPRATNTEVPVATQPTETAPVVEATEAAVPEATAPPTMEATQALLPVTGQGGATEIFAFVSGESTVQYEVGETFFDENNRFSTAVGKTTEISGTVEVDRQNPQNSKLGPIDVNIESFTSDSGRRDNTIRERFLESGRFPIARFVPTAVSNLPATYTEGQEVTFQVTGDLMVRETTRPVTFEVTAVLAGDELRGQATTTLKMSDFGVGPIVTGVLGTEDEVIVTFDFVARPQA